MNELKRIGWKFCSGLVFVLNILRVISAIYLGLSAVVYLIELLDAETTGGKQWATFAGMAVAAIVLFLLSNVFYNLKEKIKDKVLFSSQKYYSHETLAEFERDYRQGMTLGYSEEDIYWMTKQLQSEGKFLSSQGYSSNYQYESTTDSYQGAIDIDAERIISSSELAGYIKKGSEAPQEELDALIGLEPVKTEIKKLRTRFEYEKMRHTTKSASVCRHMCFTGNPGTGKTTVARIVSGLLYEIGIIKKNQVVEVSGNDLAGQYMGYTGKRTKRIIEAAKGGVLFIDEAYLLTDNASSYEGGSYGDEALGELVKAMEDLKDDIVIVFAGYPKNMERFLNKNVGMRSRIKHYIKFPDYTPSEMGDILVMIANSLDYTVSNELKAEFIRYCSYKLIPDDNFANARTTRECLDEIITKHAENITSGATDKNEMNHLSIKDFPWFAKER